MAMVTLDIRLQLWCTPFLGDFAPCPTCGQAATASRSFWGHAFYCCCCCCCCFCFTSPFKVAVYSTSIFQQPAAYSTSIFHQTDRGHCMEEEEAGDWRMTLTSHTLSVAKLPQDQGEEAITSDHASGLYSEFARIKESMQSDITLLTTSTSCW